MTTLKITSLVHDLGRKRALVTFEWENDPEKHLGLVVPFDCTLETMEAEAAKAIKALAKELETATLRRA